MGATLCSFRSRARHGFFFLRIHYSDDLHVSSIPCSLSNKLPLIIFYVIIVTVQTLAKRVSRNHIFMFNTP